MSQFCVIEGTKITLNNKETLPIEKIKVGQEILSFNLSTLQKAQKNDTLLKLSTDTFDGVFQEDLIKNIWKNEVEEYYSINDKLKITGDHIVLAKRDKTFYWTTVDKLLIGDYLFTEQNIFEKIDMIILIKEKVKVYNLQVNDVYNYFANSYLIHNGAPCGASCAACGVSTYDLSLEIAGDELSSIGVVTVKINEQTEYMSSASNTKSFGGLTAGIDYPFTVENGEGLYFNVPEGDLDNCTTNITEVNKPMTTPSSYTINILGTASFKINVVS